MTSSLKWHIQEEEVRAILARSRKRADAHGVLMTGSLPHIFGGAVELAAGLIHAMGTDIQHAELALDAMR